MPKILQKEGQVVSLVDLTRIHLNSPSYIHHHHHWLHSPYKARACITIVVYLFLPCDFLPQTLIPISLRSCKSCDFPYSPFLQYFFYVYIYISCLELFPFFLHSICPNHLSLEFLVPND